MSASRPGRHELASCTLFVDGACRGNPGPSAAGIVIQDADGTVLLERGLFLGAGTNNVAEYRALVEGLGLAAQLNFERVSVRTDSQLLVRQILGDYRVKDEKLRPLFQEALRRLRGFAGSDIQHIPRAENKHADRLANKAMNLAGDCEDDI